MTNNSGPHVNVMLFKNIKTDQGTEIEEGSSGVLVERFGEGFILEFALEDENLVGGKRFETVCLGADCFAVTGYQEN